MAKQCHRGLLLLFVFRNIFIEGLDQLFIVLLSEMGHEIRSVALELADRAIEFAIWTFFEVIIHVAPCSSGAAKIRTVFRHGSYHPASDNGRRYLEILLATSWAIVLP